LPKRNLLAPELLLFLLRALFGEVDVDLLVTFALLMQSLRALLPVATSNPPLVSMLKSMMVRLGAAGGCGGGGSRTLGAAAPTTPPPPTFLVTDTPFNLPRGRQGRPKEACMGAAPPSASGGGSCSTLTGAGLEWRVLRLTREAPSSSSSVLEDADADVVVVVACCVVEAQEGGPVTRLGGEEAPDAAPETAPLGSELGITPVAR